MQDNVTQAEIIVARHIDAWGWGPLDQIEGLAEYKLAVDACAAGLASTTAQTEAVQKLVDLLRWAEIQVCSHEETHRGGVLWEICDSCGAKWADDEGGKPEFQWPAEIEAAQAFLAAHRESQP